MAEREKVRTGEGGGAALDLPVPSLEGRALRRGILGGIRPWMALAAFGIGCLAVSIAFAHSRATARAEQRETSGKGSRPEGSENLALFIVAHESTACPRPSADAAVLAAQPPAALHPSAHRGRFVPLLARFEPDRRPRSASFARAPPAVPPRHGTVVWGTVVWGAVG